MFGWFLSLVTFPGVVIHEWAHKQFCDLARVPVIKVCYFRFGNPAGYVIHAEPSSFLPTLFISLGPLILNSTIAIALSYAASHGVLEAFYRAFLFWIAFSVGVNAFPSDGDMKNVAFSSFRNGALPLFLLVLPLIVLIWVANKLRYFWFDAIYAATLLLLGIYFRPPW